MEAILPAAAIVPVLLGAVAMAGGPDAARRDRNPLH